MNCLARSTGKLLKLLVARYENSLRASGPSTSCSTMWCDWSNSTQLSRHARCSSRQFEYSAGTTGYTYAPTCELRSRFTGFPTVFSRSSRLWRLIFLSFFLAARCLGWPKVLAYLSLRGLLNPQLPSQPPTAFSTPNCQRPIPNHSQHPTPKLSVIGNWELGIGSGWSLDFGRWAFRR